VALAASPGLGPALKWVLASHAGLLGLVVVAAALADAVPLRDRLGLLPSRLGAGETLLCVIGLLCLSSAEFQIVEALDLLGRGSLGRIDQLIAQGRAANPWAVLLVLGLSAGLVEELAFRGFVQRMVAERWGNLVGILVAALAFGAMHWDPVHSPAAAVMGVYLGTVAGIAGSVWPAVWCHIANNFFGVGLGLAAVQIAGPPTALGVPLLLLASLLCLGTVLRRRGLPPPPRESQSGCRPGASGL